MSQDAGQHMGWCMRSELPLNHTASTRISVAKKNSRAAGQRMTAVTAPARPTTLPPLDTIRGVLFDIDGTLCDSDPLHYQARARPTGMKKVWGRARAHSLGVFACLDFGACSRRDYASTFNRLACNTSAMQDTLFHLTESVWVQLCSVSKGLAVTRPSARFCWRRGSKATRVASPFHANTLMSTFPAATTLFWAGNYGRTGRRCDWQCVCDRCEASAHCSADIRR